MNDEHEKGAVSRRRFLRQSAVTAAALGAGSLLGPAEQYAVEAAGPLSPLQPPPDELLVTIQQINSISSFNLTTLTNTLESILSPLGWKLQSLQEIVFNGQVAGGGKTTYTVIRYYNANASGRPALPAVGAILHHRPKVQGSLPSGNFFVSVTPNWAIAAAGSGFIEGGPGGIPTADVACGKGWHFTFPTLPSGGVFGKAATAATVVVLDTSPSLDSLNSAVKMFPGNALLGDVVTQLTAPGHWYDALDPASESLAARQRPCGSAKLYSRYVMEDHGLFVSGIIRDIAPTCDLQLVRVLNQWGGAYLSDLLAGLAQVPTTGQVVVNMSLTVRMPSLSKLQAQLAASPDPVVSRLAQKWTLEDACSPLDIFLQQLAAKQVFLVAATGNDSGLGPLRDPCVPATFDTTLGVAAVTQLNQRACYSNRADESDAVRNGIATFGGSLGGAVHGLYSAPYIEWPGETKGPNNAGGWAQWMGTSFATPVIAALAANYLGNNHLATPADVIKQLHIAAMKTDATLQARTIPAIQRCP